jgi:hypothetical protein
MIAELEKVILGFIEPEKKGLFTITFLLYPKLAFRYFPEREEEL